MKVGDLVQYNDKFVEGRNVGVVVRSWREPRADRGMVDLHLVSVLWTPIDVVTHYASAFKVISEADCENR